MWCGSEECEDEIKEKTDATMGVFLLTKENNSDTCICCGKQCKEMVYLASILNDYAGTV